jgi:hypothetical protein
MRALPSHDAVTTRDPSGLKLADDTACPCLPGGTISLPVAASQMRPVRSHDAATICDPSGLNAPDDTVSSCLPIRDSILVVSGPPSVIPGLPAGPHAFRPQPHQRKASGGSIMAQVRSHRGS